MAKINGAQSVEVIPGRRIVYSKGTGMTNVNELRWLSDTVLAEAHNWKLLGWVYVADCSEMDPVDAEEGAVLVEMTKKFVDAGCKAFAFVDGYSVMLKVQSKKNTEQAATGVIEEHFKTKEDALAWIKNFFNI
ncbi:MAG: hypothetical protein IJB96_06210 [Lachnospira sp.]|nr:hypothetical protein [Lachnospira sp.]